jgi:hypothetical protein
MKNANAAVLSLLATGQYLIYSIYKVTFTSGAVLYVTDADFNPLTISGQLYSGGLIFKRSSFDQTNDLTVQRLTLTISPQFDYPGGPPTVGGYPFLAAVRQGTFDAAVVNWSKLFLPIPTPSNYYTWPDTTTYAPVPWFTGLIADSQAGRQSAVLQVDSTISLLNVQMPRNLIQSGCSHILYDAGCTLSKATFTSNYTVGSGLTPGALTWAATASSTDDYFDLGVVKFTSGSNSGLSRTVRVSKNLGGAGTQFTILTPLPQAPAVGDTFTAVPGCDKQQSTCSTKFSNLAHFRGFPYVPVPETQYDGGAVSTAVPKPKIPLGTQLGGLGRFPTYKP